MQLSWYIFGGLIVFLVVNYAFRGHSRSNKKSEAQEQAGAKKSRRQAAIESTWVVPSGVSEPLPQPGLGIDNIEQATSAFERESQRKPSLDLKEELREEIDRLQPTVPPIGTRKPRPDSTPVPTTEPKAQSTPRPAPPAPSLPPDADHLPKRCSSCGSSVWYEGKLSFEEPGMYGLYELVDVCNNCGETRTRRNSRKP